MTGKPNSPSQTRLAPLLIPFWLGLIFLSLGGCKHYHLGPPGGHLPFRTLYIEPVTNDAYIPQAQALLTENLIEAFLRDGSIQIVDQSQADATLHVAISDYRRNLTSVQESDTALGRSFGLTLEAQTSLIDNRSSEIYFNNRTLSADEQAFVDSGLTQAEYQTVPLLARDLARQIKDSVLSVW